MLLAVQPITASYMPASPNSVEPTRAAVASDHLLGVSPRITEAPFPDPRSLVGRANAYDRDPNTCGFYSDGYPLLCYASTATCAYGSKYAGCCASGSTCSTIFTGCYGFSDVLDGSCKSENIVKQTQMACCFDRSAPYCVLHTLVSSSTTLGVWGCASTLTGERIQMTNPILKPSDDSSSTSRTRTSSSSSRTTATSSSSSSHTSGAVATDSSAADSDSSSGEKKSNTGAIVGGVVGGIGGLAIIGAGIFFFLRSRKKESADSSPAAAVAQPMLQHHQQSPPPGQGGAQYGYHPQGGSPVYDPNMAYQQNFQSPPQPYPPSQQSPYDPYQSGYSWGQPSPGPSTSPGPLASTTPGSLAPATPGPHSPGPAAAAPHHAPAVELSNSNAVGTTENRAELG
ncbi:hypothetical protein PWT90_01089 [Aphanocladium album]|nr:hypothetical protein PWT90_01089 [Aphanocladium album]